MRYLAIILLVLFTQACWSVDRAAGKTCADKQAARLVSLQGALFVDSGGNGDWRPAQLNATLCEGSRVRLEDYSRASLLLPDGIILRLDAGTVLSLNGIEAEKPTLLALLKGFVHFISRTPRHLEITNPIANAGPEGTEFAMRVDDNTASLWVYEGGVRFFNQQGSLRLDPGQGAQAQRGQAPQAKIDIKPQDAVNWALYYPPLLPFPDKSTIIDADMGTAIRDFRLGHTDLALARLNSLTPDRQTTYFFKVRGAMRLTAGQVNPALQDIHALLASKPNDADALALQSVLALTQNRKDEAYSLANRAIASDPHSATAYSALSYAEQGRFDLDNALKAAGLAVEYAPNDAMAWARKAELELSSGLTSASKQSAERALALDATLERTQTVMGFAYLLGLDTEAALRSFTTAVQLDSTSPLARLGLGLTKIRDGDLEQGRRDMEIAAILDPSNALIRSYLGKAYFEERRATLAEDQYSLAKQRDPKDPTAYFYDAVNKQTTNRPIAALHDMQKAIELNDNRAVYRSKLMLDSDAAARSAGLGRIYNDLGFQQRGLLEGWKSIDADPSDYSGHRLLADNYLALPRHEIARVSELLKAQLLQPVNITPVQPQAAESNLLILDGLGSSIASFNEYNPLFARDRLALQATGFYGGNDTLSDEVIQSGVWDRFSYSLGQFHYRTDGFRPNNQQKKDLYTVFAQAEIIKGTSAQLELRRSEESYGDVNQGFFVDNFSLAKNGNKDSDLIRGGLHQQFSENADLLVSVVHKEDKAASLDDSQGVDINYSRKTRGTQFELQQLYRHRYFDITAGMDYLINQKSGVGVFVPFNFEFDLSNDLEHKGFYLYSNIKLFPELLMTLGLSQDFYHESNPTLADLNRNPINPKFGLTWQPSKATTLRFAAFQSLKRGIIQKQTLEPTQVAGFNQFFDDLDGAIGRRIGLGLDHKLTANVFTGAEISRRDINTLLAGIDENGTPNTKKIKWHENNARAYVNWTPDEWFALGLNYNYEELDRNSEFYDLSEDNKAVNFFTRLATHRTQLFGSFFHPSGYIAKLSVSYVDQSGNFVDIYGDEPSPKTSRFWMLDTELAYRLPRRHGLVTVGVKNLLDQKVNYQGSDVNTPALPQGIFPYGRLTLSF